MNKELNVYRREIKYVIPLSKAYVIKNCLDTTLNRDSHYNGKPYKIRSLYFDSINNKNFNEKMAGVENRRKYRLRIYGNSKSVCKLEKKEKFGVLQQKQSLFLNKEEVIRCAKGDFSVLRKYFDDSKFAVATYNDLITNCYKPVCIIDYDRCAYVHPLYDTRVTLDLSVKTNETNLDLFSKTNDLFVQDDIAILEYKYSGEPVDYISQLISGFGLEPSAYSKYCNGRPTYYSIF